MNTFYEPTLPYRIFSRQARQGRQVSDSHFFFPLRPLRSLREIFRYLVAA